MIIGIKTDNKGIKTLEKITVWRTETYVYFESNGAWFYKPIISESETIDMEDTVPAGYTVSATGRAGEKWSSCLGDYTIICMEYCGRPVYKNRSLYLYSLESGAWEVAPSVGSSKPALRSIKEAPSPALCQQWAYRDDEKKFKPGDVEVMFKSDHGSIKSSPRNGIGSISNKNMEFWP